MTRDISAYIRELLFDHDCVIIPGFGAFIGNFSPAHIDREEGLFYPPVKKIAFNRHLIANDGLLIGHISARTTIGYGEARDLVAEYTEKLQRKISGGEKVTIDHVGTFSTNREGTIIFETDTEANYLLTSYGLDFYHRKPVRDFDIRSKVLEYHGKSSVSQPSVRRLLTRAAVIIPLLVALAVVPFNTRIFKGKISESTLNPLAKAELDYNREQITTTPPLPETPVDSLANSVPEPAAAEVLSEVKYLLIIGSFKGESNALTMVDKLRNKGYDPEVAAGPDGFLRVSAATFSTLDEAKTVLLKLTVIYPGAWIYKTR